MYLFKIAVAFLSVGGAGYALIKINEFPFWLKAVCVMTATAALIAALPELPKGFDAVHETWNKIDALLPHRSTSSLPTAASPPFPDHPRGLPLLIYPSVPHPHPP